MINWVRSHTRPACGSPCCGRVAHRSSCARSCRVRGGDWLGHLVFSLDAARLPAVLAARTTYWLRYFWADMGVVEDGRRVRYDSRRRWPGPSGAGCRALVEVGDPYQVDELGELDHFLTARYVLYASVAGRLVYAHAEHPP